MGRGVAMGEGQRQLDTGGDGGKAGGGQGSAGAWVRVEGGHKGGGGGEQARLALLTDGVGD